MPTIHELIVYYLLFFHGNPVAFVFMHILVLWILAMVMHDWITGYHICEVSVTDSATQHDLTTGALTHLRCIHKGCSRWYSMAEINARGVEVQ
jgi:hypothetical protein